VPQYFEVVFDTGSGHLMLPSTLCRSETCKNHRRYKRRSSVTAVDIDVDGSEVKPAQSRDQITVSFGTGEVTGIFMQDDMCLGTPAAVATNSLLQTNVHTLHKLPLNEAKEAKEASAPAGGALVESQAGAEVRDGCLNMRFVSATDMSDDPFGSFTFDGVIGLGLKSLSQTPEFNFIEAAARKGAWGNPGMERTFAVFLAISENEESEITFGGIRTSRIEPGNELVWCDVRDKDQGYWQLDVFGIRAGGEPVNFCGEGQRCRAVVDTGTSLLGVPSSLGVVLGDLLRFRADPATGKCDGPGPDLEIDLGNITVVLSAGDYGRPEFVPESNATGHNGPPHDEAYCVPMLMYIDLPLPLFPKTLILGEPVLQRYYTAFDAGAPRVGFAPALHTTPEPVYA